MRIVPKSTSHIRTLSITLAMSTLLIACGSGSSDDTAVSTESGIPTLTVAASFYPIAEIVARVGGDTTQVVRLTPPGEGAHDVQLTAKNLEALSNSDAVFYISDGFQPDIEKALTSLPGAVVKTDLLNSLTVLDIVSQLDGTEGEADGEVLASGKDPHVWLDPANMIVMAKVVQTTLTNLAPQFTSDFKTNAETYIAELEKLGSEIDTQLKTCTSRALVTSHRAFAYLAKRANLTQVAIAGVNPEEEPSAKSLEAIAAFAKKNNVSTIFFETLLPADLAKTLAEQVGATANLLDPIEGISSEDLSAGATYLSIQRDNLARISQGLGCS